MTKSSIAHRKYVPGSSRLPRSARTLALHMAMELERQQEVGARIKELRGPKPQPLIADEVGVTLRAYQEWEAGGGIAWANLQKLAAVFNVSENYLLYGAAETRGPQTQLDRIESKLNELLGRLPMAQATEVPNETPDALDVAGAEAVQAAEDGPPGSSQEENGSSTATPLHGK